MTNKNPSYLAYTKLGAGPTPLLAFHGIGQDGIGCYQSFAETLRIHYTTFAFDLPFHGRNEDFTFQTITKSLLKNLLSNFLEKEKIDRFDVAGFSIGGRFALAVLEAFAERIDRVYLMAPDGVSENPLYGLATRWTMPRKLFKWSMRQPEPFFAVINILEKANLVNKSLGRFTVQMLNTPEKRQQIYHSWVGFSELRFDIPHIYRLISRHQIDAYLFSGTYDKLLKSAALSPLTTLLPVENHILVKTGHTQLVQHAGTWISGFLTKLSDT